jgi:hypothetical protein
MDGTGRYAQHLLALMYEKGRIAAAWFRSPATLFSLAGKWVLWAPWIAVAVLLMIRPVRRRILGWTKRLLYRGNSRAVAASFYMEALDLLDSHGMRRSREQTPMEFAQSLESHPAGIPFLSLTLIYNAVRFGPPEGDFSHTQAETLLHSLRRSLHSSR